MDAKERLDASLLQVALAAKEVMNTMRNSHNITFIADARAVAALEIAIQEWTSANEDYLNFIDQPPPPPEL